MEAQHFNEIYLSYLFFVGSTQKNHQQIFSNPENYLHIHIAADKFKRKACSTVCKCKDLKYFKIIKTEYYPVSNEALSYLLLLNDL